MRKLAALFVLMFYLLGSQMAAAQSATSGTGSAICHGHFPNPITDTCWGCFFPLSFGPVDIWGGTYDDAEENPSLPICLCGSPIPRVGLEFGFWEPVRLIDVTTKPFCFPNLGGLSLNPGLHLGLGQNTGGHQVGGAHQNTATYQVHYYVYPLFYLLELLNDFLCFEQASFDVAYMSELDPTWQDDTLSALVYPEEAVFANQIAQVACVADCIATTAHLPLDALFWCSGCNGAMYPVSGNVGAASTLDQSMRLDAERMIFKLHRTGIAWGTMGNKGLCGKYIMPILRKQQYRMQQINPNAMVSGKAACAPIGGSTNLPNAAHTYPVIGEDVGYLVWRKRNCCAF